MGKCVEWIRSRIEVLDFCSHFIGQISVARVHINVKGARKYSPSRNSSSWQRLEAMEGEQGLLGVELPLPHWIPMASSPSVVWPRIVVLDHRCLQYSLGNVVFSQHDYNPGLAQVSLDKEENLV